MDRGVRSGSETARAARSRASGHFDKIFFGLCAVAGGVSIAVVDAFDGSKWIAVSICVGLMVFYAVASFRVPGLKLRPDQAADNLYYLGLLFTLTSLGIALIRFTNSEQATDAILRNFGIAIFTTIVGLGLRVFVGQFREDPEDLEYEAKAALSESVHRMRRELDLSVAELRSFADGMRQVVGEFTARANKSTVEALEQAVGQFESAAASMGKRFETSAETFSERVQSFDASLERVVSAVEGLMDRIGAVRADADVLERGLAPALQAVEQAVAAFAQSVVQEQAKFEAGTAAVGRFNEAATGLTEAGSAVASAAQDLRTAGSALSEVSGLVSGLSEAAGSAARSTEAFSGRLEEIATRADARHVQSVEAIQQSADAAGSAATAEAAERLRALETAAQSAVQALTTLDKEFAGSGETIARVRRELTELAGWIIARLER